MGWSRDLGGVRVGMIRPEGPVGCACGLNWVLLELPG